MPPKRKASTASAPTPTAASTRPKRGAAKKAAEAVAATAAPDGNDSSSEHEAPPKKKVKTTKAKNDPAVDADKEDDSDKKMVTVLKRGAAPVDPVSGKSYTHQVLQADGQVWDAMLNQTNVVANNNKFYVLQLLHPIGQPNAPTLFTRWGRVGDDGQTQTKGPFDVNGAIAAFKKQFSAKAGSSWDTRHSMVPKKGKYVWIERDYEEEKPAEAKADTKERDALETEAEPEAEPECTLKPEVMSLCQIIFSTKLIDSALSSMNYDARKAPLGKLAKSTILRGFETLKTLSEVLDDPNCAAAKQFPDFQTACAELTGRYYSVIPHEFGRRRPPVIGDKAMLKNELELVDALGDMQVASKLISTTSHTDLSGNRINAFDFYYNSLGLVSMDPVDKASSEFEAIKSYTHDSHGTTHYFNSTIEEVFRVEREGEADRWQKGGYNDLVDGERLLLWHGSRATNFAGILKQGLRIAPPEAPVSGYMFGKGVYFADMMSKSAGYTCYYQSDNQALMLLCEVAALPCYELKNADYNAADGCKSSQKLATKGIGRTQPTEWQDAGEVLEYEELKGCHMPKGKAKDLNLPGAYLQYNEYIVYSVEQIRLRYLIRLKMH